MREVHILNLGGGVQSSTLYILSMKGRIPKFHCAINADTQEDFGAEERRRGLPDPPLSVYSHMDWLIEYGTGIRTRLIPGLEESFYPASTTAEMWLDLIAGNTSRPDGIPVLIRSKGSIGDDLMRGENTTGQRFASIPAYTAPIEGASRSQIGQLQRQCTKEYKIEVIERAIRRDVLGLAPGCRIPKGICIIQHIGISWDERHRAFDIRRRFLKEDGTEKENWKVVFDLLTLEGPHTPGWTRGRCGVYLRENVPHEVGDSSCVFCPFHDHPRWAKAMDAPATRERLVTLDTRLRTPGAIVNRSLDQKIYLTPECRPLTDIDFADTAQQKFALEGESGFGMECEGGCGF